MDICGYFRRRTAFLLAGTLFRMRNRTLRRCPTGFRSPNKKSYSSSGQRNCAVHKSSVADKRNTVGYNHTGYSFFTKCCIRILPTFWNTADFFDRHPLYGSGDCAFHGKLLVCKICYFISTIQRIQLNGAYRQLSGCCNICHKPIAVQHLQ